MIDRNQEEFGSAGSSIEGRGEAPPRAAALPIIEGYDLLRCLDSGGQGSVFFAYQKNTGRRVAVKMLRDIGGDRELRRERLRREASFLSRLHHPNIVTIHDIGTVDGQLFLVTDFIDGVPIDDHVILQGANVREIVEMVVKVCEAIAVAHTAGVIHRDLKPQNIVVDENSQPYVVDFGLAQSLGDELPRISEVDAVVGTVEYLPPERIAGHHPDTRSDVYALGMILYECIADRLPFDGDNRAAMLHAIVYDDPIPLRKASAGEKLNPNTTPGNISRDLESVVLKALARDIKERYQTATEVAADLRRYLDNEPVLARTSSTGYMVQRLLRRYKVHVSAAVLLLVMLVASLIVTTSAWQATRESVTQTQAAYQMAALQLIGDFTRGTSPSETAINHLKSVLEVTAQLDRLSPIVEVQLYNAHYRLADIYLARNDLDLARQHVESLFELAPKVLASGEGHTQAASSQFLRGKLALKEKRHDEALAALLPAIAEYERIARDPPNDYPYDFQIANICIQAAYAFDGLGQADRSFEHHAKAWRLRKTMVEESRDNVNFVVRLAQSELLIAMWHLDRDESLNVRHVLDLCDSGIDRLERLSENNTTWYVREILRKLENARAQAIAATETVGPV